jgi:hypothetical protein
MKMALPSSSTPSSPSSSALAAAPPTSEIQTQELAQIELQDRLNLHSIKALHYMRSQRPNNTSRAYISKHQEWQVRNYLLLSSYEKLMDTIEFLQKARLPRR